MINNEKYYKEVVKNRMYKNVAKLWGIRNVENVDPLVKLLIEALASEIYKLSNEMNGIETRLLERIAALLTPDILMTVRPAHMIIHALPVDDRVVIRKNEGFYSEEGGKTLNFYPADTFQLLKGQVKSLICGDKIFFIDQEQYQEMYAKSHLLSEAASHTMWIGLDVVPALTSFQDISFYFDILNIEDKNELLHLLPYTRWEFEGMPLQVTSGIHRDKEKRNKETPFSAYDLANVSDDNIIKIYDYQFVTVLSEIQNKNSLRKKLPDEVAPFFPDVLNDPELTSLLWIKVVFPPNFETYVMENFFVSLNAFPVVNKKFYSKHFKTHKISSVVPLDAEENEYVLSVDSVLDSKGKEYKPLPYHNEAQDYGTYVIKKGGVERFDARSAKEYISNLVDILREEGASFSMIGRGFVDELIAKINEQINTIEKKINEINITRDLTSYMIIDTADIGRSVFVDYWVTNCELANDIKTGVILFPFNETQVDTSSVISLTQSMGGRRLQSKKALDLYKYILTSRDRIYTDADVVNFCFAHFGDFITSSEVKKGLMISPRPKEGLIRCMDVFVELKPSVLHQSKTEEIKARLVNLLKEKSPDSYNYRVFIVNQ